MLGVLLRRRRRSRAPRARFGSVRVELARRHRERQTPAKRLVCDRASFAAGMRPAIDAEPARVCREVMGPEIDVLIERRGSCPPPRLNEEPFALLGDRADFPARLGGFGSGVVALDRAHDRLLFGEACRARSLCKDGSGPGSSPPEPAEAAAARRTRRRAGARLRATNLIIGRRRGR